MIFILYDISVIFIKLGNVHGQLKISRQKIRTSTVAHLESQFMLEKVGNTSIVLIRLGCEERKGPAYTIERLHVRGIKCPRET